jgi:hypothetical protein
MQRRHHNADKPAVLGDGRVRVGFGSAPGPAAPGSGGGNGTRTYRAPLAYSAPSCCKLQPSLPDATTGNSTSTSPPVAARRPRQAVAGSHDAQGPQEDRAPQQEEGQKKDTARVLRGCCAASTCVVNVAGRKVQKR